MCSTGNIIWMSFAARSEEHTSELQSQSNLVCRLLLAKKQCCGANFVSADWIATESASYSSMRRTLRSLVVTGEEGTGALESENRAHIRLTAGKLRSRA